MMGDTKNQGCEFLRAPPNNSIFAREDGRSNSRVLLENAQTLRFFNTGKARTEMFVIFANGHGSAALTGGPASFSFFMQI